MIKNNNMNKTIPLFAALAALLIAVPLRIYQYSKIINPETGFYDKIDASVFVLYIILGIAVVIGLVVPFLRHTSAKPVPLSNKSVGFAVVSLLMAICLIIDSASQLMDYFELYSANQMLSNQAMKQLISVQGGTLLLLQAAFGAFSAVYFFVTGITIGLGNSDSSKFRILALVPTVWCIFRLLYRFKRTISFVNVSDLLLELFLIVFSMMFFFALAQVNSKIDSFSDGGSTVQSVFWKIYGYGIPAALFAVVCFLPRFILRATGKPALINPSYGVNFSDFSFAVFTLYTCLTAVRADKEAIE